MVSLVVERATSDMLVGPDWAMNEEICNIVNHDPREARDVVKSLKKRLGSRKPKVQMLVLTLLETLVKNCGDIVHMNVAEKDIPHEMVKIVKKKPDFRVKEKILTLIDAWQESFGGPRARYPQYYTAYQELLRAGVAFSQRSERFTPIFTHPKTQPLTSYLQNYRNPDYWQGAAESPAESDFTTLSLTEIQHARVIMDVLADMLNAIGPGNREGLRQESILDLVGQCRAYKQRVLHLVNLTSDESLLCQGLALNDDLQQLLAKHEAIASSLNQELSDVHDHAVSTANNRMLPDCSSTSSTRAGNQSRQISLPARPEPRGLATPLVRADPELDLLSGEDYKSPKAENSLALVPVGEPNPTSPLSQQNVLALVDMFSQNNNTTDSLNSHSTYSNGQAYPSTPSFQQQQTFWSSQPTFYSNGSGSNTGSSQYDQSMGAHGTGSAWNILVSQQHQPAYGAQSSGALPPPPWEAQPIDGTQPGGNYYPPKVQVTQVVVTYTQPVQNDPHPHTLGSDQVVGMHIQPITNGQLSAIHNHQSVQSNQLIGMHSQAIQASHTMGVPMQGSLLTSMHHLQSPTNHLASYGYGQHSDAWFLEQRMHRLALRDDSNLMNASHHALSPSYLLPTKPSKPEDKLFGDLVDLAMSKHKKQTPGRVGSI